MLRFLEDENECKQIEEVLDGFWSFKERTEVSRLLNVINWFRK
jgi:hypothetical protein